MIGRTKLSNVELPDGVKPTNSHVALNNLVGPEGEERQILRDNMPFGTVGDGQYGTYYIAYSRSPAITEEMLARMFIGAPPGNYDRILDFSTAVTGTLFFVPTSDFLEDPPALPGSPPPQLDTPPSQPITPSSSSSPEVSLGIGGLRNEQDQ